MTNGREQDPRHPIGVVVRRTGITAHVLRAWEKRYGVVRPVRTAGGQRLYSDADVLRLRLLRQATELGRGIGQLSRLPASELLKLIREDEAARGAPAAEEAEAAGGDEEAAYVAAGLSAAERMEPGELYGVLMRAVVKLRPAAYLSGVMGPLLEEVGARWHRGELGPAQEHLVSVAVRRVLGWLLDTYEPGAGAPVVVATTLEGEQHEFGAMLASAVAAEEGWRVVYLGPGLPVAEIAAAARALGAAAVALSAVYIPAPAALVAEVSALRGRLSSGVVLIVGGRCVRGVAAELTAGGATTVEDLDDFRALLRAVRRTRQETRNA